MAETEAVSQKKMIHAGHWGSVTKTISQVYEVLLDSEANSSKLGGKQCLTLVEKLDVLKKLDEDILKAIVEDNLEHEIEQADSFRDKIHLAIIDIDKVLGPRSDKIFLSGRGLEEGTSTPLPTDRPSLETDREGTSSRSPGPKVKLQKTELKKFNGDVTNLITFWYSFDSAIHSNNELANVDKFNYLILSSSDLLPKQSQS